MPESVHVAIPPFSADDLLEQFGFKGSENLSLDVTKSIMEMFHILNSNSIDRETAVGILRSYEQKNGQADDRSVRVQKFLGLLRTATGKDTLLRTIKNLGYFSKNELEEYAKETGDWSHFLRRVDRDKKIAS